MAWKIKVYQEWKGKNTKKAYVGETPTNDNKVVPYRLKTSTSPREQDALLQKNFQAYIR